ncbi:hypothetical protein BVRB_4g086680 [Beta vulgaris subsp. vulgaris]|nr:hypothetical protein BVRB_4g086680 [Beta vulgaris subsp. vulgaris]
MHKGSSSSTRIQTICGCGISVAKVRSWTKDNLGKMFVGCKFYNPKTGNRGCSMFCWLDDDNTNWQRNVINDLVMEKKNMLSDVRSLKKELGMVKEEKLKLAPQLDNLKLKAKKGVESSK